jgi:hypothetical protein
VQYLYPHCTVIIDEEAQYIETRFADGATVGSTPNQDAHTLRMAEALGYGTDTWAMSRDHEMAHTWLAHVAGMPWSNTFWRIAHPTADGSIGDDEVADEETRVLDFQRQLDKAGARPWDVADVPKLDTLPW